MMQRGVNRQTARVSCDFCVSIDGRHERRSFEINLRCASTITVVHRLRGALNDCHAINRDVCVLLIVILFISSILLSIWFLCILRRIVVRGTLA